MTFVVVDARLSPGSAGVSEFNVPLEKLRAVAQLVHVAAPKECKNKEAIAVDLDAFVAKIVGEIEEGRHDRAELAASSRGCLSENIGVARHA